MMEGPCKFKKICDWLEETDDYGDLELFKNDDTGIALLYINNPAKKNALTGKIMSKFAKLITELERWKKGKCLIVYGSRNFFCSGLNLNLVKQIIDREWHSAQMALLMTDNFRRLRNLSLITIALVEGKALGGGAEFATNLDMRIFTECSQLGFVHKKMGISTAWTGAISLTKLLGPFKAIEILLSARLINGEEAFNLGLANYVISSTKVKSSTDNSTNTIYQLNKPNQSNQQSNNNPIVVNQLDSIKKDNLKQQSIQNQSPTQQIIQPKDNLKQLESFDIKEDLPVLNAKVNENYCKKIFKRLKKKDEDKEDKLRTLPKRCKLDIDNNCEKMKVDKEDKNEKLEKQKTKKIKNSEKNEPTKMFKKMRRILFDAEEKFVIKPEVELSSCSDDDDLIEKIQLNKTDQLEPNQVDKTASPLILDGQSQFKVGLSSEDDNTILNLVYNWLAKLTIVHDNWAELKKLVREQPVHDFDLLTHLNLKLFNHNTTSKCNLDNNENNKWQVLKSINNSVTNQI